MNKDNIDITEIRINDIFRYAGEVFFGLEDLRDASFRKYNMKEHMNDRPYVVLVQERFPCFDSEDSANEDRFYQNYYLTTDWAKAKQICEDEAAGNGLFPSGSCESPIKGGSGNTEYLLYVKRVPQ